MLLIKINGVDMTSKVKSQSLKIDMDSSHYKTCNLTLENLAIDDGVPEEGKILSVEYVASPNILLYEGIINTKQIKQLSPASNKLTVALTSNGFRSLPYRRTVSEIMSIVAPAETISAGYIMSYFVTTSLASEGITFNTDIMDGKLYEDDQEFICMSIGDIFDKLATDSMGNWYIDINKELHFVEEYATEDGNSQYDIDIDLGITADVRNLDLKTDLNNYANKVFFKGDLEDADLNEISVFKQDDAEIAHMAELDGGSGVYGISVSNAKIKTVAEAEEYCQKILDKRKVKPKSITFDTFDWLQFAVGEKHNVNIPLIGVHNTVLKPNNYVVESISLTDMGNGILTKKVDMRQLFSDVSTGGVTWQKSQQGARFFQALANGVKQAQANTKDMIKNHSYVENLRGGKLSTQNFEGTGNYIELEREFETWWDSSSPSAPKMAMGFVKDKDGNTIPGIVFGAGDGQGTNRGYIEKKSDGLYIYYLNSLNGVAHIKLGSDGKLYLNGTVINAIPLDGSNQIVSTLLSDGATWNTKLSKMAYDGTKWSGKLAKDLTTNVNTYLNVDGTYGDLTLYYLSNELFKIYNGTDYVSLSAFGDSILEYVNTTNKTKPKGTWDFTDATVFGLTTSSVTQLKKSGSNTEYAEITGNGTTCNFTSNVSVK